MDENWNRNLKLFLISQAVSLFGSSLAGFAIIWYITLETKSGIMMTIAILSSYLPTFFLSPFAGVWADRYNRKKLIILSDSIIALVTLVLAILFLNGYNAFWLLFFVLAIRAFGTGVHTPAVGAFLPQIVPEDKLSRANALFGTIQSVVMLVSPMLSGALFAITNIETLFFIDVGTAAIAVTILLLFLHIPAHAKAQSKQKFSYFDDMREGFAYIMNHGFIKTLFVFNIAHFIFVAPLAFLTPLQVTRSFGADVWRLTSVEMTYSAGVTIGGVIMAVWGGMRNKIHTMVISTLVIGFCTIALGIVPIFWIYLSLMVMVGLVLPLFNVPFTVLLQHKVDGDFLGRVFSVLGMIASAVMPLAMLAFGPVADSIRIEWLLIGCGILIFIMGILMLLNKVLIEAGEPVLEQVDS